MFEESSSKKKTLIAAGYIVLVGLISMYLIYSVTFWINKAFQTRSFYWVMGIIGALFLAVTVTGVKNLMYKSKTSTILSGIFNAFFVLLAAISIILEIARLALFIFVKDVMVQRIVYLVFGFSAIAATVMIFLIGIVRTKMLKHVSYNIAYKQGHGQLVKKELSGFKIALISDTHIGFYVGPKHMTRIVNKVNEVKADLILIAGDIMNSPKMSDCKKPAEIARVLARLSAPCGVYAVTGNHDPEISDSEFACFMNDADIKVLDDTAIELDRIVLAGRKSAAVSGERMKLREICSDAVKPLIVLDHDPKGIDEAADCGAFAVLCGHTHKGQTWPFNYFARFSHRGFRFWGANDKHGTVSVVTSGAGIFGIPLRVGSSNEIVTINIKFM